MAITEAVIVEPLGGPEGLHVVERPRLTFVPRGVLMQIEAAEAHGMLEGRNSFGKIIRNPFEPRRKVSGTTSNHWQGLWQPSLNPVVMS